MNWRALGTHWLTLAAVWALQALFFWPLLTPDGAARLYLDDRDFIGAFFNYYSFTAQELAAGRLALWNPWVFGGHPSLADLQSAVFSPLGLLWSLAIGGREASVHLVQLRAFLSYLLLSGGVYLLCWQLTRLPLAAAFGAIAFSLSSFAAFYPFTQTPILETLAWLPLTLFALERYARRGAPGWLAAAALSGSGLIFGGHAQTTLFAAATTACWLLYRWLTCRRQCAWTALPALLAFALLVAGLGAVQLLPALELIPLSNRAAITYEQAAVGFTPAALLGLALPDYLEGHSAYAGVLPLLLALLALLRGRGADRWFWLLLALGGALLSLGGNGPLYPLLHAGVPGFALFTHQERAIGLTVLAVAVLAAHGLALLWGRSRRSRGYGGIDLVAIALVAALAALAVALREPAASGAEGQWRYALSLALAGLLLLGAAWRGSIGLPALNGALFALLALDLFLATNPMVLRAQPVWPQEDVGGAMAIIEEDRQQRSTTDPQALLSRLRVQTSDEDLFLPHAGHLLGVQQAGGTSPLVVARVQQLREANQEWRLWQLQDVGYTVARRELGSEGLQKLGEAGQLKVYRVLNQAQRFWAVTDLRLAADAEQSLALTLHPSFDPLRTAVLEQQPPLALPANGQPQLQTEVELYEPQQIRLRTSSACDSLLVASEAWYPGWQAYLDGAPAPSYVANHALRSLLLPAGEHTVEWRYQPDSFRIGAGLSALALFLCLVLLIASLRRPGSTAGSGRRYPTRYR